MKKMKKDEKNTQDNNTNKNQVIKSHNFDKEKKQLENFSKTIHTNIELKKVDTNGGLFGLFEHKVTGEEVNILTRQIQDYLISMNNIDIQIIKEFDQVHKIFEVLDKDYIQGILISTRASEEASRQAKEAALEAKKNTKDIKKAMEVQKITINSLNDFKNNIEKYENLENIDEIWSDIQTIKNDKINHDEKLNKLFKQVKIAYILAGSSIIISIIIFVLSILGII